MGGWEAPLRRRRLHRRSKCPRTPNKGYVPFYSSVCLLFVSLSLNPICRAAVPEGAESLRWEIMRDKNLCFERRVRSVGSCACFTATSNSR